MPVLTLNTNLSPLSTTIVGSFADECVVVLSAPVITKLVLAPSSPTDRVYVGKLPSFR